MRQTLELRRHPFCLSVFGCLCLAVFIPRLESFQVKTSDSPILQLLGEDAVLPCLISDGTNTEFDLEKLTVIWTHRLQNGSLNKVYEYSTASVTPGRPGSRISIDDLKRGNAALTMSHVQISDEGEYTCTVFYTPNKVVGKTTLQVSAQPTVSLSDTKVEILLGTEKSVTCIVIGFYPKSVDVKWVVYKKNGIDCIPLEKQVCTSSPALMKDGTYNVTSHVTLNPKLQDDGNTYVCVVTPKLLRNEQSQNFTLSVKEMEKTDITAVAISVTVLLLVCILLAVWYIFFRKVSPILSNITGHESLVHKNRATLSCQITNFRPRAIEISVYLERVGGSKVMAGQWKSEEQNRARNNTALETNSILGDYHLVSVIGHENGLSNGSSVLRPPMELELTAEIKTNNTNRTSSCQCSIHLTPDKDEDNDALLTLQVKHASLKEPQSIRCVLKVNGVPPKLSQIVAPLQIVHKDYLTLTCAINGFKPRPLTVMWLKVDAADFTGHMTELLSSGQDGQPIQVAKYSHKRLETANDDDHTYSILSTLTMKPTIKEDHGAKYICRIFHPSTGKSIEKSMIMEVSAKPVLDPIQSNHDETQEPLNLENNIKLSCRIHSYYNQTLTVTWYKGDTILPFKNSEILTDSCGLFYFTSNVSYWPQIKDIGKEFKCEVAHESLESPISQSWTLKNLISRPKISNIQCQPEKPACRKPVTLSCTIRDFYPEDSDIKWYRGLKELTNGVDTENAHKDTSGLFCRTTNLRFTPSEEDQSAQFIMRLYHCGKNTEQKFSLKLEGLPVVKNIICDTINIKYEDSLTLRCDVVNCNPADISAEWIENKTRIKRIDRATTKENHQERCKSFILQVIPTAEDYAKKYTCLVKHKDTQTLLGKASTLLKLPEISPTLSEITVYPLKPEVNTETTFTINISRFAPKHIEVKWFKEFKILTENIITSEQKIGQGGLFCCTSTVKYIPEGNDKQIRCEVLHGSNKKRQEKCYKLNFKGNPGIVSEDGGPTNPVMPQFGNPGIRPVDGGPRDPIVPKSGEGKKPRSTGIICKTNNPRPGDDVMLACCINGPDSRNGVFSWYNGMFPIVDNIHAFNNSDGSGCISTVTFKPDISETEFQIRFEATFNYETIEENYVLKLA
ncbi:natural cytotoxicity triggering receptor 3 ligand 1 [Pelobates fuscus]|uniref:natural cytotoxicity triggering receptor 3 ligand 1 n=1 Tax=Pelobates fuscus TaxID=191477 RepID=UPI002FE45E22